MINLGGMWGSAVEGINFKEDGECNLFYIIEEGISIYCNRDNPLGVSGLFFVHPPKTFTRPAIIESINKSVLELAEQFLDSGIRGRS